MGPLETGTGTNHERTNHEHSRMSTLTTNVDTSAPEARERAAAHAVLVDELRAKTRTASLGGPAASRERHIGRGKLLPRDRVARLLDEHSPFLEFSALAANGC